MNRQWHGLASGHAEQQTQSIPKPRSEPRQLRSISQLATSFNRRRNSALDVSTSSEPTLSSTSSSTNIPVYGGLTTITKPSPMHLSPHLLPRRTAIPRSVTLIALLQPASHSRTTQVKPSSSQTSTNLISNAQASNTEGSAEAKRPWVRSSSSIIKWRHRQTSEQNTFDNSPNRRQLARATQAAAIHDSSSVTGSRLNSAQIGLTCVSTTSSPYPDRYVGMRERNINEIKSEQVDIPVRSPQHITGAKDHLPSGLCWPGKHPNKPAIFKVCRVIPRLVSVC